jgi:arsenite oxidase large subunit
MVYKAMSFPQAFPNYKQTWAAIRKLSDAPDSARRLSFKSLEYAVG